MAPNGTQSGSARICPAGSFGFDQSKSAVAGLLPLSRYEFLAHRHYRRSDGCHPHPSDAGEDSAKVP